MKKPRRRESGKIRRTTPAEITGSVEEESIFDVERLFRFRRRSRSRLLPEFQMLQYLVHDEFVIADGYQPHPGPAFGTDQWDNLIHPPEQPCPVGGRSSAVRGRFDFEGSTGMKFMNWHRGVGGGGAIDLIIHLHHLDFKTALQWLGSNFPESCSLKRTVTVAPSSSLLLPSVTVLPKVRRYLVHNRGISSGVVDWLVDTGNLYADHRSNAVFPMRGKDNRIIGAELRGTLTRSWKGMAPGSKKDLGYFSVHSHHAASIVLCESAIDAISCFLLHQDLTCISIAGARPKILWLGQLTMNGCSVFCGYDADPVGESMAQRISSSYPSVRRLRPPKKDWNDALTSRLKYLCS